MFDRLYMQILDMSKTASIVILVVIIARLLLKKAPKAFSYCLWALVLFRLLCPVAFETQISIVPYMTSVSQGYTLADEPITVLDAGEAAYQAVGDALNGGLGIQHIPTAEKTEDGLTRYVTTDWWSVWILFGKYVWVAGMSAMLIYSMCSYLKIRKKIQIAVTLRDNILIADDILTPFVIGFFRPKIYLPCNLGAREQEYIIEHEQYHIHRLDHIMKALAFLALTIHWQNPLAWIAFILACKDMEMSCDEAVIRKLGPDVRAEYSASLLTLATGHRIIAGTPLAFGEGDTKGRIKNLAKWKKPALLGVILTLAVCLVLGVCLLTDRRSGNASHVGVTDYFGNVIQHHSEGERPHLTVMCHDGNRRDFYYDAENEDIPESLLGKQIKVRARIQELTGSLFTWQVETVSDDWHSTLDEAIQAAILAHHSYDYGENVLECVNFISLASNDGGIPNENGIRTVTQYGVVYHQDYRLENSTLVEESGCNVPTALTFRISDEGQYILAQYWEPRDGSYYSEDIKAKFPLFVRPDTAEHLFAQKIAIFQQVMDGFSVGKSVVIDHLITDICERERWAPSFSDLMLMCELQRDLLSYYGSDTLKYCFGVFLQGQDNAFRGQVMAYVCSEIINSMGEQLTEERPIPQLDENWFDVYAQQALTLPETYSHDEIRRQYPASWILLSLMGRVPPTPDWGITLSARNVTAKGLTLVFDQSGWRPTGRLIYGREYHLQTFKNGEWVQVEPIVEELVWTSEAYVLPINGSKKIRIDWSNIYGTLQPGLYRIGKGISDHRGPGDNDHGVFYAEFTIA